MGGKLIGIGVGPGDPELLTLKAVRRLKECDIIVLPAESREKCYAYRTCVKAVPEIEKKETICMPFPMAKDEQKLNTAISRFTEEITAELDKGKTAAFLTIGDPSIYATYHYLHRRVVERGYDAEMISAVPSFVAVASRLGISLADKEEQIHIIPGSYDITDCEKYPGTRIYMKSGKYLKNLKESLLYEQENGDGNLKVYAVANCGMENERVMIGLENVDENADYLTTVIVKG